MTLCSYPSAASRVVPESLDSAAVVAPTPETDSVGEAGYRELEEFVFVEQKKLTQSDGAKLTYNVAEDPESGSSNILDILRKVPGVSVDAQDNVKVNGQSSFKILMDGHENPMLKGDIKTVLKSLPASTIRKIEVISEPGAKYEAEGVGGILNIVTDKKQILTGFLTQLSGWVNSYQAGGYVNARTKISKVMLDATVSHNNGKVWPRSVTQSGETEYLTDGPNRLLRSESKAKNGWEYTGVSLNSSWEPDTLNLFTLSANYSNNTWDNIGWEDRTMSGADMTALWNIHRDYDLRGRYNGTGLSASYQHTFGRQDHTIVASYEYDYGHQHQNTDYIFRNISGGTGESPFSSSRETSGFGTHIFQIDYSNQFDSRHLLEAGAKANLNPSDADRRPYFGTDSSDAILDEEMRVDMKQFKDIYAIYSSWSGSFKNWSIKAGLRYEHTDMGLRYRIGDYPDFTTRLNDFVPNAAVSYNFTQASSLRAAYQMRISRPGLWNLTPYVNVMTPGKISYGNPDLKSEKSHNLSLTYSNYGGKFSGFAKINYMYVNNSITDVIFIKDDILNSTYANVGNVRSLQMDLSGDWSITPLLRWSLYLSGCYNYFSADSEMLTAKNCGWQYYANTNINYTLPRKFRLSGYGGLYTPWRDLQSKGSDLGYYYGLGASRSFLKEDALTIQLSLSNILPSKRHNGYVQTDRTAKLTSRSVFSQWNVGLSVSFKFGGLKADVRKTAANIEKESTGAQAGGRGGKD